MRSVELPDVSLRTVTAAETHVLLGTLAVLHDAEDLAAFGALLHRCITDLVPHDALDIVGSVEMEARGGAAEHLHRLAIRTVGGGRTLIGLRLGRANGPFSHHDEVMGALMGPALGAAADHVYLRAMHRRQMEAVAVLTEREREVLELVADGRTNRDIGESLFITEGTVKNHVKSILAKLQAHDRTHAVMVGLERGIIGV